MTSSVSLFRYVHGRLNVYRLGISIGASVLVAGLFSGAMLYSKISADRQMVQALSPYLATLVESQDRPELLRVLRSIAQTSGVEMILVQEGRVLASSRDFSEMDRPLIETHPSTKVFDLEVSQGQIAAKVPVVAQGRILADARIYIPVLAALRPALFVAGLVFLLFLATSATAFFQMRKAIRFALAPLERLHQEIRGLGTFTMFPSEPIPIRELEEIRQTIRSTKNELANARDRLAEERAKQLSADSYKRLIHDLHTPIAALRQNVRLLTSESLDDVGRQEANESIPRIADQILSQIAAAKRNLEHQPEALREADVRECIEESVLQVESSQARLAKKIVLQVPGSPVIAAHDPDLLKRAIVNLVENALHAASREVRVALQEPSSTRGPSILVSDDGPGMNTSLVALHLQGRGKSSKVDRQAYGLSSANHIARAHGGRIIYRPSPDLGGASFEIRLGAQ